MIIANLSITNSYIIFMIVYNILLLLTRFHRSNAKIYHPVNFDM